MLIILLWEIIEDITCSYICISRKVSQCIACLFFQVSEVSIQLYSLVHWEDPMDMTLSPPGGPPSSGAPSSIKEGTVQYRSGTTYLGKELWKSCYIVLRYGQVKHVSPLFCWY